MLPVALLSDSSSMRTGTPVAPPASTALPEMSGVAPAQPGPTKQRPRRWPPAALAVALLFLTMLTPVKADLDDGIVFINQEHDLVDNMAWGDMDGDGDLDVAVGSFDWVDGRIGLIYENSESGPFTLKWSLYQGAGEIIGYPAWGDIDGDGDLDVSFGHTVFANTANGFVKVFHAPIEESELRNKASWADFDGDGDLDFALGGTVYPNNNGSLSAAGVVIAFGEVSAWGDMDYDGDLDMALLGEDHEDVQIYRQEADGSFSLVLQTALIDSRWDGDYPAYPSDLDWGDMDGDTDLDLAVSTYGWHVGFIFHNTGTGFEIDPQDNPQGAATVAWGDWDNGGYPELAYGTCPGELINCDEYDAHRPPEVYENWPDAEGKRFLSQERVWISETNNAEYVAWADWDSDGDLDLSTAFDTDSELIYINEETGFRADDYTEVAANNGAWGNLDSDPALEFVTDGEFATANKAQIWDFIDDHLSPWPTSLGVTGWGVATGDFDGDNDLDVAVGGDVFRNQNGTFQHYWEATADDAEMQYPVWVDWDGDGDLELTLQDASQVYLYRYDPQQDEFTLEWESPDLTVVYYTDWGDLDGDGLLDLAIARGWTATLDDYLPSLVFRNTGAGLIQVWEAPTAHNTSLVAWGDWDGDGDSDLALGNWNDRNQVYANNGGQLELAWESGDFYSTYYIAWLDYDSDGDLDLAAANEWHDVVLYANDGNTLGQPIALEYSETRSLTVGDADADGDLDLLVIDADQYDGETWAQFIENKRQDRQAQSPYHTAVTIRAPGVVTNYYGVGRILDQSSIPIDYILYNDNGDTVGRAEFFYSLNGGGQWLSALNSAGLSSQNNLSASPTGVEHIFTWDIRESGLFGRFDNVVFRIDVYNHAADPAPAGTYQYPNVAMRTFQRPAKISAQTTPFRVRGAQVRVVDEGGVAVQGAIVYRLKAGETTAELVSNGQGRVFTTDGSGYLQGHGELKPGDKLIALAPVEHEPNGKYTVYHTSAAVTGIGPAMYTVTDEPGAQTLTISPDNTLVLYNLVVSLEWDARQDSSFMSRLEQDIVRASQILYDLTDGQAALGRVDVHHDKGYWGIANVVIPAANDVRPAATLGGIVSEPTDDVALSGPILDVYVPGQIRIGPTWNRFGDADGTLGEDWPRALAHELGHYLFFLPDNYLGLSPSGHLKLVDCPGSVMTNPYLDSYSEFLIGADWSGDCLDTLAERTFGRADWETIDALIHDSGGAAVLRPPNATSTNDGPANLPLAVTTVSYYGPPDGPATLAAPLFPVQNGNGQPLAIPVGRSQAYLIKARRQGDGTGYETGPTARYVVALGSVVGDLIQARGAASGDLLCVFDYSGTINRSGCITVGNSPAPIPLTEVPGYNPFITVKGVADSKTVEVTVANVASQSALSVQVLPALGAASAEIAMTKQGDGTFKATVTTLDHAFYGYARVWAPGANPPKETIVAFTNVEAWQGYNWGDYGYAWGNPNAWGGYAYAWGGYAYAWGGYAYAWGAPMISNDGQVSFLPQGSLFGPAEPLSLQSLPVAPGLPSWLTPVGQAYRLKALNGSVPAGAMLFRYLARDVPAGLEDHLTIYFLPEGGTTWVERPTLRQAHYNHAVADTAGPGVYVLVATVVLPPFDQGWNTFGFPVQGSRPVQQALQSIAGKYTAVYYYNGAAWELYDPGVEPTFASLVNKLTHLVYPRTYWLYATEPTTLYLSGDPVTAGVQADAAVNRHFPPATYYGRVTPGPGFIPAAGMSVTAQIGAVVCGQSVVVNHNSQLAYTIQAQAETITGSPDGCGRLGQTVTFKVGNQLMTGSAPWDNAQARRQDLTSPATPAAPVAAFTGAPLSGQAPLTVNFTDQSTNNPTGWAWTFGDTSTSTAQHPSHTYTTAGTYTVSLTATNVGGGDGETKTAYITVNSPPSLYVTPTTGGTVGGVAATPQDILFRDGTANTWAMHFDGSDVGVTKAISAFARLPNGDLLLVFKANQPTLAGTFTPWDVARFTPTSLGPATTGTFSWYIDGGDVGLTTTAEKIDALDVLSDGRVVISTGGALAVSKTGGGTLKSQDEDLAVLNHTSLGAVTAGTWALYFDGTNGTAVPGLGVEDVVGAHVVGPGGDIYITILGTFTVGGISGNDKDVLKLTPAGGGYIVTMFWRGPSNGFNLVPGGIELP